MPEKDAEKTAYNPFDLTKVWPHKDYPLIEVGNMELNRNPGNYFAEVEQSAFEPSNVVPGISFSPDKMLQFRIFASPTRTATGLGARIMRSSRSTGRAAQCILIIGTAPCALTATTAGR